MKIDWVEKGFVPRLGKVGRNLNLSSSQGAAVED